MKKILIVFLFIITSCGYQPLYKVDVDKDKIKIRGIEFVGDKTLGKRIYSGLILEIMENNTSLNKLVLNSKKNIFETSKNSRGQTISYRTSLDVKLSFFNNNNELIKEKTLSKNFSYNIQENKFKFKEYQINVENNLKNKIIEDINIYLNF